MVATDSRRPRPAGRASCRCRQAGSERGPSHRAPRRGCSPPAPRAASCASSGRPRRHPVPHARRDLAAAVAEPSAVGGAALGPRRRRRRVPGAAARRRPARPLPRRRRRPRRCCWRPRGTTLAPRAVTAARAGAATAADPDSPLCSTPGPADASPERAGSGGRVRRPARPDRPGGARSCPVSGCSWRPSRPRASPPSR